MAYPYTETGYNMYDMFSLMQKAIRRGKYEQAGFAARQLKNTYRGAMWNRLLVISAEDCYGIITKEILKLRKKDYKQQADENIGNAIALMCRSLKSRDACYFACNFVLVSRKPRDVEVSDEEINAIKKETQFDDSGFQISLFDESTNRQEIIHAAKLVKAIAHIDCDMAGYFADKLRKEHRELLWDTLEINAKNEIKSEIIALREADEIVNKRKNEKDEIFSSKALVLSMYEKDPSINNMKGCNIINSEDEIDWRKYCVKKLESCRLENGVIPEWTYDCHTMKGKKAGKTDWEMTINEQCALKPKQKCYFDEASWIYTYEEDFKNGIISNDEIEEIRKYASTHEANPVNHIEY